MATIRPIAVDDHLDRAAGCDSGQRVDRQQIVLVPFKARHLHRLDLQQSQRYLSSYMTDEELKGLENTKYCQAWTYLVDGEPVGCCGVLRQWEGRAVAWMYLDKGAGRHLIRGVRFIKRYLETTPYRRIEATVDEGFEEGHRLVKMLGFKLEAECMTGFLPNGGNAALYARVK